MSSRPYVVMLAPLPEYKTPWKSFAGSLGLQAMAIALICGAGLLVPAQFVAPEHYDITELVAPPPISDYIPRPPERVVPRQSPPPLVAQSETPKLEIPVRMIAPAKPKVITEVLPPAIVTKPTGSAQLAAPRPAAVVHTGGFGGTTPAQVTTTRRPQDVQTGGFGDPNGLPGQGSGRGHLVAARLGSFDLPAGPGYGNGTGGARGVRGTVATAGFGERPTAGAGGTGMVGTVQQAGFGDARAVTPPAERRVTRAVTGPTTPVEIVSKPHPDYTEEARRLKIEGEVVLEARFGANGTLQVLRVVRGMGHGLDEAAVRAAQQIRFKPAQQDGVPVDSVASLHVIFQLAY